MYKAQKANEGIIGEVQKKTHINCNRTYPGKHTRPNRSKSRTVKSGKHGRLAGHMKKNAALNGKKHRLVLLLPTH